VTCRHSPRPHCAENYAQASLYADEALRYAETQSGYLQGDAIHDGHLVLGMIAPHEDNIPDARVSCLIRVGDHKYPESAKPSIEHDLRQIPGDVVKPRRPCLDAL